MNKCLFISTELRRARVLFIDGLNMRTRDINNFLNLCAGASVEIFIKYGNSYATPPMPVIMLSNFVTDVPMHEKRWQSRVAQFQVKALTPEMEAQFEDAVHPLGWLKLLREELE